MLSLEYGERTNILLVCALCFYDNKYDENNNNLVGSIEPSKVASASADHLALVSNDRSDDEVGGGASATA